MTIEIRERELRRAGVVQDQPEWSDDDDDGNQTSDDEEAQEAGEYEYEYE